MEPDITETLSGGLVRTTIIEAVEITRQGKDRGWRISLPLTKQIVLPDGSTVNQPSGAVAYDMADLAHDPAVVALYTGLRDVTIRIARGDLKPIDSGINQ
jgi:hypothetical protein